MVRAITVLATFRSSRNSCIGLLGKNIRINYCAIDFSRVSNKKKPPEHAIHFRVSCSGGFFLFELCLLAARARTVQTRRNHQNKIHSTAGKMIVDNNSEPKNNNASLQSNN